MTPFRLMRSDFVTYGIGYLLALGLTGTAFALTYFHLAPTGTAFAVILVLGLIQIVVHMRCFLHMSLQHSARSDLMLILFSVLIIALMAGGTLVVLFDLRVRMM